MADVLGLLLHAVERRDHHGVGQRDCGGLDALALLVGEAGGQELVVVRRGVDVGVPQGRVEVVQRIEEGAPLVGDVVGRIVGQVLEDGNADNSAAADPDAVRSVSSAWWSATMSQ